MDPPKVPNGFTPVFIFLDENLPPIQNKSFAGVMNSQQCQINVIQFPKAKKGVADFEVVLWMKKVILSGWHQIEQAFANGHEPIFILFTNDLDFIEDAQNAMMAEQRKEACLISFHVNRICFMRQREDVCVYISRIRQRGRSNKGLLINQMIRVLHNNLIPPKFC